VLTNLPNLVAGTQSSSTGALFGPPLPSFLPLLPNPLFFSAPAPAPFS